MIYTEHRCGTQHEGRNNLCDQILATRLPKLYNLKKRRLYQTYAIEIKYNIPTYIPTDVVFSMQYVVEVSARKSPFRLGLVIYNVSVVLAYFTLTL